MSTVVPHSPGIMVTHILATGETHALNHASILPDLYIAGITKLEDFQSKDTLRQLGLPPQVIPVYVAESQQVLGYLQAMGLNPRQTRRALRERVGNGGVTRMKSEHISRSEDVRTAFERANSIAADHEAQIVMLQHLLAALLEITDTHTRALLNEQGVDVDTLIAEIAALPMVMLTVGSDTPLLNEVGVDLTDKARNGELPLVVGRKGEMMQVIHALGRSKKNCPILVGEAGVGKTAIVEGLAQRIVAGGDRIHPDFHNKRIIQINASALVAGTKYRGDFEERMELLLAEIVATPEVIVFIDEIHQLIGAGAGSSGGMDAANIFKPALANGQIKLIGATTYAEYRQYIESDAALERRFHQVRVEEPSTQEAVEMLVGVREQLQSKHGVTILDEAIPVAVDLSVEYITDRRLPDKAYTLLDDACVMAKYGSAISFRQEDLESGGIFMIVTAETVAAVLSKQTGIPVGQLRRGSSDRIKEMSKYLRERIIGQDVALKVLCGVVERYYSGMRTNNERPIGVLLFAGPTGVGKTELAKVTAEFLFHDRQRIIRLDMGEYRQEHQVARLIGSPPGYKGYEQGGQLTNALKQSPHSIVLIDEIEKAHPDVLDVFLGLFDNGRLTDGQGRTVDGKNALYILTSNLGYTNANTYPTLEEVKQAVYSHLRPEFINRLDDIVYFNPLGLEHMEGLVQIQLGQLQLMLDKHNITVSATDEAVHWLARYGYDPQMGARALYRLFNEKIVNMISGTFVRGEISPGEVAVVSVKDDDITLQIRAGNLGTGYDR